MSGESRSSSTWVRFEALPLDTTTHGASLVNDWVMKTPMNQIWFVFEDLIKGYIVSVRVQDSYHGPVMTDLCISIAGPSVWRRSRNGERGPRLADWYLEPKKPGEQPPRVTAQALQKIRMADIWAKIREELPDPESIDDGAWRAFVAALREGEGRRRRRDLYFYANVAQLYLEAAAQTQRGVYELMAKMAPELDLAPASLKDVVKEAKRRGLLDPSPYPGVAGGKLTAKGLKHLRIGEE